MPRPRTRTRWDHPTYRYAYVREYRGMACTVIHGGSPISTGYLWKPTSRAAALRVLDDRLRAYLHGTQPAPLQSRQTCGDLFALFITTRKNRLTPRLQSEYARYMEQFVPAKRVVTDTAHLRTAIMRGVAASSYASNTRRQILKRIRAVFQFGIEQGWLTVNPVHRDMLPTEIVQAATPYTDDDVSLLLTNLLPRPRLFVAFIACTGVRAVEAVRLQWASVHRDGITIDGKRTRADIPRYRVVPFALVPELRCILDECRTYEWGQGASVFGLTHYQSMARAMKDVTQDARGFHDLRKYAINRWVRLGWPETVITAIAGHDRVVSEKHYRTPFTASELAGMVGAET